MQYKVCFIVPHFGKLLNYFPLFLKTCSTNEGFNWLVISDDDTEYDYPTNVRRIRMSFEQLKVLIQSKLEFQISLERPYKLCDYRPLYGCIFSEYLHEYSHWGHCDTDVIMGNLGRFITDEMLAEYDKLFLLGHMAIYKNEPEINQLALADYHGREIGKETLQNPKNSWFDEEWDPEHNTSINSIFRFYGKKIFEEDLSFNISLSFNKFTRGKYVGVKNTDMPFGFEIEKTKEAVYVWENGSIYRFFEKDNGSLVKEEFLYMHFQWRTMRMDSNVEHLNYFKIVNDEFLPLEVYPITSANFSEIKKSGWCWHTQRVLINRVVKKLKSLFFQ